MNLSAQFFLVGLVVAFLSMPASAEDTITIHYLDGYPLPDTSSERVDLRLSRFGPSSVNDRTSGEEIDRFFERVSGVLAANGVTGDWQLAIPDAPSIEIAIDINGLKRKLISCHTVLERSGKHLVTERGMETVPAQEHASVLAKQSENFRRHRIAFEEVLRLALERANTRLSP